MNVLLLSPVNPYRENNGYKIAVSSDILAIRAANVDLTVLYSYLNDETIDLPSYKNVLFDAEPVKAGNRYIRSVRALLSSKPAAAERYYTEAMRNKLKRYLQTNNYNFVIIEDCALAGWIELIREESPGSQIITRSHNFMQAAAWLQFQDASFWLKPFFYVDYMRWVNIEKLSVEKSDEIWAISTDEKELLSEYYQIDNCNYAPVSIDVDKYLKISLEEGDERSFCHLGEVDLKKVPGVKLFLKNVWPRLKGYRKKIRLHFGGNVAGIDISQYDDVYLEGYINSDVEFYRKSRFSVNVQIIGAGVKLKSLVSMACGRVLLSTPIGVEGMDIKDGVHYLDYTRLIQQEELGLLFDDMKIMKDVASKGRQWVQNNHSREIVASKIAELLPD